MSRVWIVGVDAATLPGRTGLARGWLEGDRVTVAEAGVGARGRSPVAVLASWLREGPALVAVDAPLGWPAPLARGLSNHRAGQPLLGDPSTLFRRLTDRRAHERTGKFSLEVGADRIARTARAALTLLHEVGESLGRPIPMAWSSADALPAVIEVYPAATLRALGLRAGGYKRALRAREVLVERLGAHCTLPDSRPDQVGSLLHTDDALDAAVCVLSGGLFLQGRCRGPEPAEEEQARQEGWMWCPEAGGARP